MILYNPQTVTTGVAANTREDIIKMCRCVVCVENVVWKV